MFLLFHFGRKGPLGSAFVMPAVGHQVGVLVYVLFHCCLLSLFAFFSICFLSCFTHSTGGTVC